jgi:hypothetical protein
LGHATAHVGAGAPTRLAGQSPAILRHKSWRAALARPDEGVRAYVAREDSPNHVGAGAPTRPAGPSPAISGLGVIH